MQTETKKDSQPKTLRHVASGFYLMGMTVAAGWVVSTLTTPIALLVLVPMFVLLLAGRHFDRRAVELSQRREDDHARLDALTGLPNRRAFLEELRACLETPLEPGHFTAVFFIDLDRFKGINDALGHMAGDRFLLEISSRLQNCLGDRGLLARFAGDEFTLLFNNASGRQEVIDLAQQLMAQFNEDVEINGHKIWASTSMGIAMVGMPRPPADEFLSMADSALYNAKAQGRGQFVLYEPNLPRPTPRSLSLDADIRTAVEKGELELCYQPVVDLAQLQIVGLEALVRWRHPRYGLLSPNEFISLAEETGVIKYLGLWVVNEACKRLSAWQGLYGDKLGMSVNLSALQFRQKELLAEIAAASARSGLEPRALQLEITESLLLKDDFQTQQTLRDLRETGFRIAVDDFGVGYSSLSYLKRFDIDTLKLDQSFLSELSEPRSQALISGTVQLGHSLGMKVVAEGIENADELNFLRKVGCDEGQGYLLCKPLDERQLIDYFTHHGRAIVLPDQQVPLEGRREVEPRVSPRYRASQAA